MGTSKKPTREKIDFKFGDNDIEEIRTEKQEPIKEAKNIEAEIRVTLQMPKELHQKVKIMANWEFATIKDIINESLKKTVVQYEKIHGQLVKVPKSKKASE